MCKSQKYSLFPTCIACIAKIELLTQIYNSRTVSFERDNSNEIKPKSGPLFHQGNQVSVRCNCPNFEKTCKCATAS